MSKLPVNLSQILSDEIIFNKEKLKIFREKERINKQRALQRMQNKNKLWESIDHAKYDKNSIDFDELLDNPDYSIEEFRWDVIYAKMDMNYYEDLIDNMNYEKTLQTNLKYDDMEYIGNSDSDEN